AYAVPSLDALSAAGHEVVGVVSQPDRRRGRGGARQPSPVKARALELGLAVITPERIRREPATRERLAALGADASVVVAFGQILPPEVLAQPPLGCWNGHGSLLPRWRGAAPIQWALMEGDAETGVGIMAMEEGLDTGPVLLERRIPIGLLEDARQLGERLAALTADLLVEALPRIEAAGPGPVAERLARLGVRPQAEAGLTYARLLTREDYAIDWTRPALALHRQVMGLYPGATTTWRERRLKLLATEPLLPRLARDLSPAAAELALQEEPAGDPQAAGTVRAIVPGLGVVVGTGEGSLLVRGAQLEGRGASAGQALLQQLSAHEGERFGAH
ncbi:MAG: methionyl-tRNA formyltransferase, partial [Synechococcaceae cyanobacterium]|nr:methionyl-tRNA formyltransferase [Synechococcaceae cyanobacterium]